MPNPLRRARPALARLRRVGARVLPEQVKRPLRGVEARVRPRLGRATAAARARAASIRARVAAARTRRTERPIDHPASLRFRAELAGLALRNRLSRRPAVDPTSDVVVTMTTHGRRIDRAYVALESIARGRVRPARLMLWLDEREVFEALPASIRRLRRRGVEIHLVDNYKVHTKYYPYLLEGRAAERDLVTSDDDIVYPEGWLAGLVEGRAEHPGLIVCYRSHRIRLEERDGVLGFADYHGWIKNYSRDASFANFGTSVSGQLFPRDFMVEVARHGDAFREISPTADDVWLHARAVAADVRVVQLTADPVLFPFVPGTQEHGLYLINDWGGQNDLQISAAYSADAIAKIDGDLRRAADPGTTTTPSTQNTPSTPDTVTP